MEGIQVSLEKAGANENISVIKVGGYIDTTTSAELEHSLSSILKSNNYNIVIDLGNVDYISSAGWGIFISEIKGIREKGGDLKLVHMIPDVYEVFELLEFNYILKAFDSLEEAVSDFDNGVATSTTGLQPETGSDARKEELPKVVTVPESPTQESQTSDMQPDNSTTSADEKLRQVVVEMPDAGVSKIIKTLNTPRFGNVKLGWFEARKLLKQLNLDSKKKRVEYFKSQTFK